MKTWSQWRSGSPFCGPTTLRLVCLELVIFAVCSARPPPPKKTPPLHMSSDASILVSMETHFYQYFIGAKWPCAASRLFVSKWFLLEIKRSKANGGPAGSSSVILNKHVWKIPKCGLIWKLIMLLVCGALFLSGRNRVCKAAAELFHRIFGQPSVPDPFLARHIWTAGRSFRLVMSGGKPRLRLFFNVAIFCFLWFLPARAVSVWGFPPEYLCRLCLPNVHR